MIDMKVLHKSPMVLATVAILGLTLGGTQALAEVKRSNGNASVAASVKYASAAYTLSCWQEGKQILQNAGTGRISLSKDFVSKSISISMESQGGSNVTVFATETAVCRLQTQDSSKR